MGVRHPMAEDMAALSQPSGQLIVDPPAAEPRIASVPTTSPDQSCWSSRWLRCHFAGSSPLGIEEEQCPDVLTVVGQREVEAEAA